MKIFVQWSILLSILLILSMGSVFANTDDDVFGVKIEQNALDVLTLASLRMTEILGSADLEQVVSIKAKIIVADMIQSGDILEQIPQMIFRTQIELFKAYPDMFRVNLDSSFGDLQFLVTGSDSLAVLPEDGIFTKMNILQMFPDKIIFPDDDNGLLTMINLLGGIPFSSLFGQPSTGDGGFGGGLNVGFVEEIKPSDVRVMIRYRGKDKTEAGIVHVVTIGSTLHRQYIKVWILEDTMDLYQISIEDERGTEVFIVIDELNTAPMPSQADFILDTSDLVEVSEEEFLGKFLWKLVSSPIIEEPVAVDLYASSYRVARTGSVTISTDGFDLRDKENELTCEVEYIGPGDSWTPLEQIEYAGLAPVGRWNAVFAPSEAAELGTYGFRTRYIDSSGNISEWLEALDLVTVIPAPPRIVRTKPVRGEVRVPISTEISATFSKPMNKEMVEKAFSVVSESGRTIRGSFTWEEKTLTFLPLDDLQYNKNHLVRINGDVTDADGIGLDGNYDTVPDGSPYDDYLWTFRTSVASPILKFVVKDQPVYKGDIFDVKIMAKFVKEMYKFSFKVAFDPEILEVKNLDKSSFASWRPRPKFIGEHDLWKKSVVDNSDGFITITCEGTRLDGVSGSGDIANITFKAVDTGVFSLEFREVVLDDPDGRQLRVDLDTAEIQVIEFHPLDVNHDGIVNILDFVVMESDQNESNQAPRLARPALGQNFPNPFNPETWIPYQLVQPSYVTIKIYRLTGEIVRTLDLSHKEVGFYTDKMKAAYWNGMDDTGQRVSSGVYFYTIQADGFTATKKMLLRK